MVAERRDIPCDVVTYHEHVAIYAPLAQIGDPRGLMTSAIREAREHWWSQSPLKLTRGAHMYSDYVTPRQFHRLELYHDVVRPLGVEDMIRLWINPSRTADGARLEFDRPDWGFRERDRDALDVMLPHLEQFRRRAARRRAGARRPLAGLLTAREREVLELVAEGRTNGEVARLLWISPETVRKHLENAYERLGVHTRTAAVAAAFGRREKS
jgi:DNA-binding CsgD family transcriptional regulator